MDRLTARMQKDLNGYADYFADELEKMIGTRCTELAPLYRRLQKSAVARLDELNKEIEKLPAAKRKSKRVIAEMQKRYVAQIQPDLELVKAAQEPYVTDVLCSTVEYGYYTQVYSLEQAAKVPVTVPMLNHSGVLGIIANDWVGDGNTYSDRIRANTNLVAKHSTKVVKKLITQRLSYNEASHELAARINESYSNANRILCTEITRANGLGSSYAAMENADILDGKYRDAVRDLRTSAYCAKDADYSYKYPYPLDYDTPVNPGIPGKRIPNHPFCRCTWRMILSAIGVERRARLARRNDSKDSYGENYYTKAKTYDAYAKARGLPSVAEMVENDNPKRYLRPGETLDSLRKKVDYRIVEGHKLSVGKQSKYNCPIDKSKKRDIIEVQTTSLTPAQYTEFLARAESLGIQIHGFNEYKGDYSILSSLLDAVADVQNKYPDMANIKNGLGLVYGDLGNTVDFAETRGKTVTLNKRLYDDTQLLLRTYAETADKGFFVKGTTHEAVFYHETGHILCRKNYRQVEEKLLRKLNEQRGDIPLNVYIASNISIYASDFNMQKFSYRELLAELIAATTSSNKKYKQFAEKLLKGVVL